MCIEHVKNTREGGMKSNTKVTQQELPEVKIEVKPKSLNEKLFAIRHISNLRIAALGDSAVSGGAGS